MSLPQNSAITPLKMENALKHLNKKKHIDQDSIKPKTSNPTVYVTDEGEEVVTSDRIMAGEF